MVKKDIDNNILSQINIGASLSWVIAKISCVRVLFSTSYLLIYIINFWINCNYVTNLKLTVTKKQFNSTLMKKYDIF